MASSSAHNRWSIKHISIKRLFFLINAIIFTFLTCIALTIIWIYDIESDLDQHQNDRYHAYLLADELRKTAEDLSKMASNFLLTGNSKYEEAYQKILEIRNGEKPRPTHYEHLRWDLVVEGLQKIENLEQAIPLENLINQIDFSEEEQTRIQNAYLYAKLLNEDEQNAIARFNGIVKTNVGKTIKQPATEYDRQAARALLDDPNYQTHKATLNSELQYFFELYDKRIGQAITDRERTAQFAFVLLMGLLLLTLLNAFVSYNIIKVKVVNPLALLKTHSQKIAVGDFTTNIHLGTNDEVGNLARAMNQLRKSLKAKSDFAILVGKQTFDQEFRPLSDKDELGMSLVKMSKNLQKTAEDDQKRLWLHEGMAKFLLILKKDDDLSKLAYDVISLFVRYLNAGQGALYFAKTQAGEKPFLELACQFGGTPIHVRKVVIGEGLLGAAAQDQQMLYLSDIRQNAKYLETATVSLALQHIVIVPLRTNHELIGIVELNSLHPFLPHELEFMETAAERIALTMADIKSEFRMRELIRDLQQKNEELLSQQEELQQNSEELQQNSEELQQITEQLQKLNDKLEDRVKERTRDLQTANAQLEQQQEELWAKNRLIEKQKAEAEQTIEALKHAQSQLVQSEKMASLGQLTAGIAHELNNPINYVSSGIVGLKMALEDLQLIIGKYNEVDEKNTIAKLKEVEKLKKDLDFEDLVKGIDELASNIATGAQRTAEIVRSLRTFSRLDESGFKSSDLHENLESTLIMLRSQYKNKIEISKDYGQIPMVECQVGKINQVFMNLIVNAIHAIESKPQMGEEEKITIRTYLSDRYPIDMAAVEISDTGTGIPEEIKNRIFEPFFTTKDVGKGTGLGLSISLSIIEDHCGHLDLESDRHGTKFTIYLPIVAQTMA